MTTPSQKVTSKENMGRYKVYYTYEGIPDGVELSTTANASSEQEAIEDAKQILSVRSNIIKVEKLESYDQPNN